MKRLFTIAILLTMTLASFAQFAFYSSMNLIPFGKPKQMIARNDQSPVVERYNFDEQGRIMSVKSGDNEVRYEWSGDNEVTMRGFTNGIEQQHMKFTATENTSKRKTFISEDGFMTITCNFKDNGAFDSGQTESGGFQIISRPIYNSPEDFVPSAAEQEMAGQSMRIDYKNIKCDSQGNPISFIMRSNGQSMEVTREITYY